MKARLDILPFGVWRERPSLFPPLLLLDRAVSSSAKPETDEAPCLVAHLPPSPSSPDYRLRRASYLLIGGSALFAVSDVLLARQGHIPVLLALTIALDLIVVSVIAFWVNRRNSSRGT